MPGTGTRAVRPHAGWPDGTADGHADGMPLVMPGVGRTTLVAGGGGAQRGPMTTERLRSTDRTHGFLEVHPRAGIGLTVLTLVLAGGLVGGAAALVLVQLVQHLVGAVGSG